MPLRHWLQLSLTDGIGPVLVGRMVAATGSAEAACDIGRDALQTIEGIGSGKSRQIFQSLAKAKSEVDAELDRCNAANVFAICPDDDRYPPALKTIFDPPSVLYVKGDLQPRDLNSVAIVGSRKCSHYGREQSERFAAMLAGAGITVVSGGARGADSAAHRGAMSHPLGRTIAVLGCGVDVVYPPENTSLFQMIAERGAVMSEFPMGSPPLQSNFPRRNRIVSGMSRGVLVVEADIKSGALITARQACDDHGRPVFALPGRVDNPMSAGPHALIRDGAILTTNLEDILDGLGPLPYEATQMGLFDPPEAANDDVAHESAAAQIDPKPAAPTANLSARQQAIIEAISESADVDTIIGRTQLPPEIVLQELTVLSLRGEVKRLEGQTYGRRKR